MATKPAGQSKQFPLSTLLMWLFVYVWAMSSKRKTVRAATSWNVFLRCSQIQRTFVWSQPDSDKMPEEKQRSESSEQNRQDDRMSLTGCKGLRSYQDGCRLVTVCTHSWWLYSVSQMGDQAASTCYIIQSHYPDTEPTSHCPILIMPTGHGRRIGLACGRSWVLPHGRVKPKTYKIDTCHSLARCSSLLG